MTRDIQEAVYLADQIDVPSTAPKVVNELANVPGAGPRKGVRACYRSAYPLLPPRGSSS
jgi:ABC-type nitrate/sulfonate/bicarbonate transport system ATPase subunit